jgi:hypothetical protein
MYNPKRFIFTKGVLMPRKSSRLVHQSKKRQGQRSKAESHASILEKPFNIDLKRFSGRGPKKIFRDVAKWPMTYLAGGVGAYILGRYLYRYYQNHPEISDFIRDNFESVEEKLREFKGSKEEDYARH